VGDSGCAEGTNGCGGVGLNDDRRLGATLRPVNFDLAVHDKYGLVSVPERDTATLQASQWSSDSTRLAYFTGVFGEGEVGVVDLAGHRTKLSLETEDAFLPLWSPDGSRLLYLHHAGTIVDPDHPSDRVEIPAGFADCAATWAPDATEILGFGTSCTELFRIPVSEPTAATKVDLPPGLINMASWRRIAP